MNNDDTKALQREILLAFWKLHILHHATKEPVYGQWMLSELRRHGYEVSPGTLYPLLHRLEQLGWLTSSVDGQGAKARRLFTATAKGHEILLAAGRQLQELRLENRE